MEKNYEDNTVIVLQKAIRKFKIKVSNTSIKEFLLAHPYYPTLKSVSDALRKWEIEHYPLKLDLNEIRDLEMPFIAHLSLAGGHLAFVEKIEKGNVVYSVDQGKNKIETFEKFAEKLSGSVIVMDADKKIGEKEYKQIRQKEFLNNVLLPIGIIAILLFAFSNSFITNQGIDIHQGLIFWGLLITKITGFVSSVFLIMHEFKVHSPLADKICGFSTKTDCDEVLASNASRLFGWINWADAGLIYFAGTFIYLFGSVGNSSLGILAVISLLSLPYPAFSIYYQSIKLKKWCPFCLLVQLVLITEFLLLVPGFKASTFSGIDVFRLVTSFFIPAVIWFLFKAYSQKLSNSENEHYSFLKFKRNPEIFRFLLKSNSNAEFPENINNLMLGSPDAPVTLTAFLSLYCNPCAKAFKQMMSLLENCPDIKINVIFSVYGDDETQKVINVLYYLNAEKGPKSTLDFLDKWYSLPKESRKPLYSKVILPEQFSIAQQIGNENHQLFEKYQVVGTPTVFVNGFLFPNQYQYGDIEYYIENIKQLTRENKRQEACAISN